MLQRSSEPLASYGDRIGIVRMGRLASACPIYSNPIYRQASTTPDSRKNVHRHRRRYAYVSSSTPITFSHRCAVLFKVKLFSLRENLVFTVEHNLNFLKSGERKGDPVPHVEGTQGRITRSGSRAPWNSPTTLRNSSSSALLHCRFLLQVPYNKMFFRLCIL